MIDIYFFRHGETNGNVSRRHQPDITRLTERGEVQAREAGIRARALNPTHFLVSTQVRAVETARLMGESLSLVPETDGLFQELIRPDDINGHYHRSFKTIKYLVRWYFGKANSTGEDGTGESYQVFRRRIKDARQQLSTYPDGSRIIVVSHSVFINMFVAHMCREERLPPFRALKYFAKIFMLRNTGVVHVRFAPEFVNKECPWRCPSAGK